MDLKTLLDDHEFEILLEQFYSYFEDGYVFEEFLREYLLEIGLDEVEVTQRSGDGGVDLKAIRKGVGDFSETDITNYYVQAKRYAPTGPKIAPNKIRELKGTLPFGYKGIFITTACFSEISKSEASNDPSKPVILVDGKALVQSCIDKQIGFVYKPVFSKKRMDVFFRKVNENVLTTIKEDGEVVVLDNTPIDSAEYVEKKLTLNDIRSRIISMPSSINSKLEPTARKVKVYFKNIEYEFNISTSNRKFLSGVTNFFKEHGALQEDGSSKEMMFKWYYNDKGNTITLIETELK
ncbi:MAG: restriction endonuclease [bacterium]